MHCRASLQSFIAEHQLAHALRRCDLIVHCRALSPSPAAALQPMHCTAVNHLRFVEQQPTHALQSKGLDTAAAAVRVSGLELGGLAGSLSAG